MAALAYTCSATSSPASFKVNCSPQARVFGHLFSRWGHNLKYLWNLWEVGPCRWEWPLTGASVEGFVAQPHFSFTLCFCTVDTIWAAASHSSHHAHPSLTLFLKLWAQIFFSWSCCQLHCHSREQGAQNKHPVTPRSFLLCVAKHLLKHSAHWDLSTRSTKA